MIIDTSTDKKMKKRAEQVKANLSHGVFGGVVTCIKHGHSKEEIARGFSLSVKDVQAVIWSMTP